MKLTLSKDEKGIPSSAICETLSGAAGPFHHSANTIAASEAIARSRHSLSE